MFALLAVAACRAPAAPSGPGTPTPLPTVNVPEGYHGLGWGTPRGRVQTAFPDARASKTNPKVLVRDTIANGMSATEAFFFDAKDALEEVELRFAPKRTAAESATIGIAMDASMGPHEVPLADDNAYQFAWTGQGTEVRLTYDLRENVAWGPVIAWAPIGSGAAATPTATVSAGTPKPGGEAGACFGTAVRAARRDGMHLTGVESVRGKLTLVFESAGNAKEITLTTDGKKLLGCATLPRAATSAALQFRAEAALDGQIAHGDPTALEFGGPHGLADLVTLRFADGWLSLRPKSADALAASSANTPR